MCYATLAALAAAVIILGGVELSVAAVAQLECIIFISGVLGIEVATVAQLAITAIAYGTEKFASTFAQYLCQELDACPS